MITRGTPLHTDEKPHIFISQTLYLPIQHGYYGHFSLSVSE